MLHSKLALKPLIALIQKHLDFNDTKYKFMITVSKI